MIKMKVLFVNYSISGYAGDSNQMTVIARGLQDLGNEVYIATTDGNGYFYDKKRSKMYESIKRKLECKSKKSIEIDGLKIISIHCISERFGMYCPSAGKIAREIIPNFDIIYIINWYYHLGMVFAKIASELKIPFIVAPMASLQEKAQNIKKRKKAFLDKLYTHKMIKCASGFHCVGKLEKDFLIKLGVKRHHRRCRYFL